MQATWIVVADASRARVLQLQDQEHLAEVQDFVNPVERNENADLRTDSYGRFYGKGEPNRGNTAEPAMSPKEHEAELFAIAIADYLDDARSQNKYARLQLIAAPAFLGLMRQKLDKQVMDLVESELPKDLSKASLPQIEQYLKH
ncbi:MAG TPA: host attachment protein [Methylophilaceae bacterium]|nr:host attachment protein [Methylophilaceae bacterium]